MPAKIHPTIKVDIGYLKATPNVKHFKFTFHKALRKDKEQRQTCVAPECAI